MDRPVYLDNNATTPVDPEVLEAALPFLRGAFGNPSSKTHSYGWEAHSAVEKARAQVATLLGTLPQNIIWTSGATESNNMALLGPIRTALKEEGKAHLITTETEHKSVLDVARALEREGAEVTYLKPDLYGRVDVKDVERSFLPHTRLVSIIMGNNEIGTLNPIPEIGERTQARNIPLHVDAAQCLGKVPMAVEDLKIDLLSASAHKIYAPKGTGILYVRKGFDLEPTLYGGDQERGLRPGTLNVMGCVAMGRACDIAHSKGDRERLRLTRMRDSLIERLISEIPTARLNGHPTERLCNNISLTFTDLPADIFAMGLKGLALSSGSACTSGEFSHVLKAIGLSDHLARSTIRIGIGRFTTEEDLHFAADQIIHCLQAQEKPHVR